MNPRYCPRFQPPPRPQSGRRRNEGRDSNGERGFALIAVLSLMLLMTVIVAAVVTASQTTRFAVATTVGMTDSIYDEESAAARAIWLLQHDRNKFPNRSPGGKSDGSEAPGERFLADGSEHIWTCNGNRMSIRITDMIAGISLNGYQPLAGLSYLGKQQLTDPDYQQELETFKNRLMDYVDNDDLLRPNGLESADYAAMELAPLPRNNRFEYREEILLIPGHEKFFVPDENGILRGINPIPPRNLQIPSAANRPHLLSAPENLIRNKCRLSDAELIRVKAALDYCRRERVSLEEAFSSAPELLLRLKAEFATTESGYYTFTIRPAADSGRPGRTMVISLKVGANLGSTALRYYQWRLY
ncbi:MAG: type II secretion system protein GspK [Victivallales bacterium]|nr:type II secretion system protein GspK [Victivallales bacterium]